MDWPYTICARLLHKSLKNLIDNTNSVRDISKTMSMLKMNIDILTSYPLHEIKNKIKQKTKQKTCPLHYAYNWSYR